MAEGFDPYHKWLGIPPKDQPPNHYRLLGIELFESDPEVIDMAAEFVPGGEVGAGDMLLRLDDADYRIALERRQSELQQAIAELEIEHGRQQIAENDYRQRNKDPQPDNRALVLREPQLRSAEAVVRGAAAALEQARQMYEASRHTVKHFTEFQYAAGSWGPVESDELLARDRRSWRRP